VIFGKTDILIFACVPESSACFGDLREDGVFPKFKPVSSFPRESILGRFFQNSFNFSGLRISDIFQTELQFQSLFFPRRKT